MTKVIQLIPEQEPEVKLGDIQINFKASEGDVKSSLDKTALQEIFNSIVEKEVTESLTGFTFPQHPKEPERKTRTDKKIIKKLNKLQIKLKRPLTFFEVMYSAKILQNPEIHLTVTDGKIIARS